MKRNSSPEYDWLQRDQLSTALAAYLDTNCARTETLKSWNAFAVEFNGTDQSPADLRPDLVKACQTAERKYVQSKRSVATIIIHEHLRLFGVALPASEVAFPDQIERRAEALLS